MITADTVKITTLYTEASAGSWMVSTMNLSVAAVAMMAQRALTITPKINVSREILPASQDSLSKLVGIVASVLALQQPMCFVSWATAPCRNRPAGFPEKCDVL